MTICYLGIGSNLGNRRDNIRLAIKKISALKYTKVLKSSRLIETTPIGGPAGQGKFLNGALKIKTNLTPHALLNKFKTIEKALGRKKAVRYAARPIDLDILFYGDRIIDSKNLKVPHPKVFERPFVIKPLLEII